MSAYYELDIAQQQTKDFKTEIRSKKISWYRLFRALTIILTSICGVKVRYPRSFLIPGFPVQKIVLVKLSLTFAQNQGQFILLQLMKSDCLSILSPNCPVLLYAGFCSKLHTLYFFHNSTYCFCQVHFLLQLFETFHRFFGYNAVSFPCLNQLFFFHFMVIDYP